MSVLRHVQNQRAAVMALCFLFAAEWAKAQTIVHSFDGDRGPGRPACESGITHCDRPEMSVAANGTQVVQVTWQNFRIYDYNGHLVQSTPLSQIIRKAGLNPVSSNPNVPNPRTTPGPYEPQIVYDEFINRWIMTVTGQSDSLLVSASSNPAGAWGGVYPSCLEGGPCLSYDPGIHLGYDKNGVYVCGAHLGDDNPHTIPEVAYDCFAIPSPEVEAIAKGTPPAHVNRRHNMPLDIMPAIDHNASKQPSAAALFAAKTCGRTPRGACQNAINYPFNWLVETFNWNGSSGTYNAGGEQEIKTDVGSARNKWLYSKPCCGEIATIPQAGNNAIGLRVAESHRLLNLVQFGSHLHGVLGSGPCTSGCGSQGEDTNNVLFWVDLDCSKTNACVVSQTAKIAGASFSPSFPTVGVDYAGNVGIVAVSSSPSTDLSILLWTHRTTDPPNIVAGPTTIVSGTQPFTCLNTRNMATIGNAVGVMTALDPQDGSKLWTSEQWSNDATRCVWNTRIVEYQMAGAQARPAAGPIACIAASFRPWGVPRRDLH
jgi:hypothetical protein